MNNVYFACTSCKVFMDAGYRWASSTLPDEGIVERGRAIDPALILAAEQYWNPEPDEHARWLLDEVLPSVRVFLKVHWTHNILFTEGDIFDTDPDWFLYWIHEGYNSQPLPRFFLERLRCESWTAVCDHINRLRFEPSWWLDHPEERARAEHWYKARLIANGIS